MSRLQGLLFALATVVLSWSSTFYFMRPWLPPLMSDRGGHRHALWWSLLVTGAGLHRHQPDAGLVQLALPGRARARRAIALARQHQAGVDLDARHRRHHVRVHVPRAGPVGAASTRTAPADAMLVEVTGQQFAWNVRYPGKDGMLGRTDHKLATAGEPASASTPPIPPRQTTCRLLNQHRTCSRTGPSACRSAPWTCCTASSCPTSA